MAFTSNERNLKALNFEIDPRLLFMSATSVDHDRLTSQSTSALEKGSSLGFRAQAPTPPLVTLLVTVKPIFRRGGMTTIRVS